MDIAWISEKGGEGSVCVVYVQALGLTMEGRGHLEE